jgi:hypothetical protein
MGLLKASNLGPLALLYTTQAVKGKKKNKILTSF